MATALDLLVPEPSKATKATKINWTKDEWERLSKLVYSLRRKHPQSSLLALLKRVQNQLPESRRRSGMSSSTIGPLLEYVKQQDDAAYTALEELDRVRAKLTFFEEQPSRDQLIEQLSEQEVLNRFQSRVLNALSPADVCSHFPIADLLGAIPTDELIGLASQRAFADLMSRDVKPAVVLPPILVQHLMAANGHTNGHANGTAKPDKPALKSFTFLCLTPEQMQKVSTNFRGRATLHFVQKNRVDKDILPKVVDYVFIWTNFTPSNYKTICKSRLRPEQIVNHFGGFNKLIEKAEECLSRS